MLPNFINIPYFFVFYENGGKMKWTQNGRMWTHNGPIMDPFGPIMDP